MKSLFGLGKGHRSAAGAARSDEDGDDELVQVDGGTVAGDPRGLAAERPLGASERHGGGRTGGLGDAASMQDGRERRKKGERRERGLSDDMVGGGGGAAGSGAGASQSRGTGGDGGRPVAASSVNDFISKTKTQKRKGLKPSGPELIAYARYLGIDPVADHDLLWIAVEALEAPLPSTWSEHFDSNDRVFYYNASTRVSSWTHPLEHVYRETYTTIVNFRNSNMSSAERAAKLQGLQKECEEMDRNVHREISLWTEHQDEQGHRFYFNAQEKQSTWTDPRPAQCHLLYLKMKLVRVLSSCAGVGVAGAAAEASRLAPPSLAGTSPRGDLGGKRAKVGPGTEGSFAGLPREQGGIGSARGSESDGHSAALTGNDNECWGDAEDENHHRHHHKKKKEKKHKKRDFIESGDEEKKERSGLNQPSLLHSQSEPAVTGQNRSAAPPPEGMGMEGRTLGGSYPAVPLNFAEGESLNQVGRTRVKAGIRLAPLQPISGGQLSGDLSAPTAMEVSSGMHMSSSVPELKPLDKPRLGEGLKPLDGRQSLN